ncbi:MAG: hypothetical protein HY923_01065 [Elusimicrobia bacterium]|nr:hypothetical protein [Elusimicrobiota bacterium]
MNVFLGLICVAAYLVYKRSTDIITVNPLSSQSKTGAPDFSAIVNTISQVAQQAASEAAQGSGGARIRQSSGGQGRAAIRSMVQNNQFIEAIQLYRRMYGVDLATAKKAVDEIMLNQ